MRFIPEYTPVKRLYLSFVDQFFNTRFGYGKTICEIVQAVKDHIDVEVWVSKKDEPVFRQECDQNGVSLDNVTVNVDSPGRGIIAEYAPIFARNDNGQGIGVVFRHPFLDDSEQLYDFSQRLTKRAGFSCFDLGFKFSTAQLLVNDDLVLLSDKGLKGEGCDEKMRFLRDMFPTQNFHLIQPLAGDVTADLDMFLWPIAPRVWIVSEYADDTPQAESIDSALKVLKQNKHTVHRVPGLPPVIYDDVNTIPNYTNGILLNGLALVPMYNREEDSVVCEILRKYDYQVVPIDCSNVILTNSGLHCITKTLPVIKSCGNN